MSCRAGIVAALFCAASLACPPAASAQFIDASLVAETSRPAAGTSTRLAIRFVPKPGWHIYWVNPGDAGMPPEAEWQVPPGVHVASLQHPAPIAISSVGLTSYVHEGDVSLLTVMKVPGDLKPGAPLPIIANVRWVSCSENMCVPERATLRADLVVGTGHDRPENAALFQSIADELPRRMPSHGSMWKVGERLQFSFTAPALSATGVRLFPTEDTFKGSAPQVVSKDGHNLVISVPADGPAPTRFAGVITVAGRGYEVEARTIAHTAETEPTAVPRPVKVQAASPAQGPSLAHSEAVRTDTSRFAATQAHAPRPAHLEVATMISPHLWVIGLGSIQLLAALVLLRLTGALNFRPFRRSGPSDGQLEF